MSTSRARVVSSIALALGVAVSLFVSGLAVALEPGATSERAGVERASAKPYNGTGILTLDNGDAAATRAGKADYVVMQAWEASRIPALKRANPNVEVLMYKDAAAVRKDASDTGIYSTGLSYAEAAAEGWLLRDGGGSVIEWSDWRGLYPTNVGSRGYQDRWLSNVSAEVRRGGWDGVMIDDTLTYLSHPTVGGRKPVAISSDAAMYAAMESFLARVGRGLSARGILAIPNVTVEWNTWRDVMEDWTPYVSGWENEFFVKWGQDRGGERFVGADWQWKSDMAAWCAKYRVPLLAITYSNVSDRISQAYHRATWLMTWNGRTGASVFAPTESNTNHWTPLSTVNLGKPRAARVVLRSGVNRRLYSRGLVLVNPTANRQRVQVGAGWMTLGGNRAARIVTMAPRTGVMLRSAS